MKRERTNGSEGIIEVGDDQMPSPPPSTNVDILSDAARTISERLEQTTADESPPHDAGGPSAPDQEQDAA
ncbi:MAG: hypothetical protein A3H88_01690 [Candidatus Blackburnbacteria bacterium RIFCSPLOWO2_02_FULL_44_9]|uniref:Uncharacterized protein n=1 Tax=Candidatus Blackburnbacteria bacterium RIFCSPHIGHO2_02_FULL_44_20 TaxID=1797516 RepID=A0A1G1V9M0_9BACT|nr:MAG: hypothetical protein A3D26_04135 [Candidatus Blackburnbacteria bacterium RIFCSPHIGHO2_02_FULL_44_20]OGY15927.1 MAG: hypothetical protein A3H88_01690 [Candidatus Blackburnbacteria bacterium RIFCSPLOWO2_02_FULL_44_9]